MRHSLAASFYISLLVFGLVESAYAEDPPSFDIPDLARAIVADIGPQIVAKQPQNGSFRVGIFAFGDQNGKVTPLMGNLPLAIQGEIEANIRPHLAQNAPGKFFVLTSFPGLKNVFETAALDPTGVNANDINGARTIINAVNINVAIVGKFNTLNPSTVSGNNISVNVSVIIGNSNETIDVTKPCAKPGVVINSGTGTSQKSGRFNVEFFVKNDNQVPDNAVNAFSLLPLKVSADPNSELQNVYFLVLDPSVKGKRYKIRLTNKGNPAVDEIPKPPPQAGMVHFFDKDRLFSAAVLIDGVNSFYQETGETNPQTNQPVTGPVIRDPKSATKWVLTAPQRQLIADVGGTLRKENNQTDPNSSTDTSKIENGKLIDVSGAGGSVVDIPGFQKNLQFADAFVFADPQQSIAETVGVTNAIGLIEVHFYQELLPPIPLSAPGGTAPGDEVSNPTFKIKFKQSNNPVEVWHIFYRYTGDNTIPTNLQPVTN